MTLSDEAFSELRAEFNIALPGLIAGKPDRTDLMKSARRIGKGPITVDEIISSVATETGVPAAEITGSRSTARVVRPRRLAMYLADELIPALTHDQIAGHFGRHETTLQISLTGARNLLKNDPQFARLYQHVRWRLGLP